MRVKSLLIVIVLNVFFMLISSVMLEYVNLAERFTNLENTFQVALDSAIGVATGSEEMFSDQFQRSLSSFASNGDNSVTYSTTLLWRNNKFHQLNSYALSYYYYLNGKLPNNASDLDNIGIKADNQLRFYYEWLYDETGSDYDSGELYWANRNNTLLDTYSNEGARPTYFKNNNRNFYDYYNKVGYMQRTAGYVKQKQEDSYSLEMETFPTLLNMGFAWMETYRQDGSKLPVSWTSNDSDVTTDNFTSSVHYGKSYRGIKNTQYFLTPMALGVTYVPVEVLKPTMLANLETLVRLSRISGGTDFDITKVDVVKTLNDADKCVTTQVWQDPNKPKLHDKQSGENIITDGYIEYDLNSLQVKVDYFYVDFGSSNKSRNSILISKLNGCISYAEDKRYDVPTVDRTNESDNRQEKLRARTLDKFLEQDSAKKVTDSTWVSTYDSVRHGRIVARISAKVKIHVPYQSSIMQWMCERSGNPGHYDIKLFDPATGKVINDSDGLWYQYTTYYMQSRV